MSHYAGIDVSLEASSVCVVDGNGKIVREAEVASEPETLITWLRALKLDLARIGLEAGPLSQRLHGALRQAGFAVELLETRHVRNAFKIMPVKTDRNDARGIAELMRLGWFRPVHCKTMEAQERARCSPRASSCKQNFMISKSETLTDRTRHFVLQGYRRYGIRCDPSAGSTPVDRSSCQVRESP
jgi:transposase